MSYKALNYFAYHKKELRYRTFAIPKKTPGETREIKAPVPGLLRVQRLLLRCLTAAFTTCDPAAHGFVPGRSVRSNAEPHVGRRFVLNLDLKDFFPSTSEKRIVAVLQLPPFALRKPVAALVASLCCDQDSLPQGAPTSPLLTNAVCQRLDRRLRQLARGHYCTYTRYADDLTFSSNRPAFRKRFPCRTERDSDERRLPAEPAQATPATAAPAPGSNRRSSKRAPQRAPRVHQRHSFPAARVGKVWL